MSTEFTAVHAHVLAVRGGRGRARSPGQEMEGAPPHQPSKVTDVVKKNAHNTKPVKHTTTKWSLLCISNAAMLS